jgi:hypoxanthine phosphoribosyltransferase
VGKRILLVDEVDDSRETLGFAVRELLADIAAQEAALATAGQPVPPTHLGVFVIHNKLRPKKGVLPDHVPEFVAQVGWLHLWLGALNGRIFQACPAVLCRLAAELLLRLLSAQELDGAPWIVYPWDAPDIEEHNRLGQASTQ